MIRKITQNELKCQYFLKYELSAQLNKDTLGCWSNLPISIILEFKTKSRVAGATPAMQSKTNQIFDSVEFEFLAGS